MSDIVVSDNIPIPGANSSRSPAVETARGLNVNQSFVWPNPDGVSNKMLMNRIRGVLARVPDMRFTSRSVVEKEPSPSGPPGATVDVSRVRVWRIA